MHLTLEKLSVKPPLIIISLCFGNSVSHLLEFVKVKVNRFVTKHSLETTFEILLFILHTTNFKTPKRAQIIRLQSPARSHDSSSSATKPTSKTKHSLQPLIFMQHSTYFNTPKHARITPLHSRLKKVQKQKATSKHSSFLSTQHISTHPKKLQNTPTSRIFIATQKS